MKKLFLALLLLLIGSSFGQPLFATNSPSINNPVNTKKSLKQTPSTACTYNSQGNQSSSCVEVSPCANNGQCLYGRYCSTRSGTGYCDPGQACTYTSSGGQMSNCYESPGSTCTNSGQCLAGRTCYGGSCHNGS